MSKCLINFSSEADGERYNFFVSGDYIETGEEKTITYEETIENSATLKTELKIVNNDFAVFTRKGDFSSILEFKKNYISDTVYRTPYGSFDMRIVTKDLLFREQGHFINLKIEYESDISGYRSRNSMDIIIKLLQEV